MKVTFEMEKVTKNTIRFAELMETELDAPKIGSIYIPKTTLKEIGYTEGNLITIEIKTA